ncbi:hypothetical protein [Nocardia brasiliensis]|uniref:hypothetical protein n=1 Tax=Nocardia brasiliensis TaxID=37326 RepID=UPI0024582562|nr:hypothetical protein [Nocardia brasiliensis]
MAGTERIETVADLIEALSNMPQDLTARVYIPDRDYGGYFEDVCGITLDPEGYVELEYG